MPDIHIDLSTYNDRFVVWSELVLKKKLNFVFWKNGTGKTTIVDAIQQQFSTSYDIHVFNGYEWIIWENESLDAIALGTENTEIQKKIEEKDREIALINKEFDISQPEDNLAKKEDVAKKKYNEQKNKIQDFFSNSASIIKKETTPQIASTNYDKNDFEKEINQSKLLSEEEIQKYKTVIKEDKKDDVIKINFPQLKGNEVLSQVNSILWKAISIKTKISELDENREKQNFAKEWLKIHEHKNWEKCAFCGNVISEERWELLGKYFDTEVLNLENDIEKILLAINTETQNIENIVSINKDQFYEQFKPWIESCNAQIKIIKDGYKIFLNILKTTLEEKKKNLFTTSSLLTIDIPQDFSNIEKEYKEIVNKNNILSNNLGTEKITAKNNLRYHEVKKALDEFRYEAESQKLKDLNDEKKKIEEEVNDKKTELAKKQEERKALIEQTKDEWKLAKKINECLKNTWLESFTLELVPSSITSEKWQYRIKWHNSTDDPSTWRSVKKLSTWEKNIIAFLYFVFKLQSPEIATNKNKLVVLDDPMTSNDDTMQYLMVSEIQKLYRKMADDDKFLLLTHNIHFYLNVRPYYNKAEDDKESDPNKKYHKKNHYFKLKSNGKLSEIIQILSADDDFRSNYHALRDDLLYLYNNDKPLSMINNCRRILETYINFNCYNHNNFYQDNEEAKKLFNVNSHGIEDLECEPNGKTKDEIKNLLKWVFEKNNDLEHFNSYFSQ